MQAGGSLALGTASHEVTHILIHRAAEKRARSVPSWLHEGLAEYGNLNSGFSYDAALDFAIETNRLLPITTMQGMPGTADDIMIFYGQSKSLISFIAETYGEESITELMATIKSGKNAGSAFQIVYGISLLEVENLWRISVGAPEYALLDKEKLLPTPIPIATIAPYTVKNLSTLGQATQKESSPLINKENDSEKSAEIVEEIHSTPNESTDSQQLTPASCDPSKSVEGLNKMIDRCKAYIDAGAEIIFPEALKDEKDFETVRKELNCYLLANMTEFGKSKLFTYKELENFGYNIVIYPVTTQRLAMKSVEEGLRTIFVDGHQNDIIDKMQTRKRLYELVEYEKYNALDEKIYNFSTKGHE